MYIYFISLSTDNYKQNKSATADKLVEIGQIILLHTALTSLARYT